ncbi:fungal-specific transcription factor domain-containing protein, partial [Phycomyces blakesleeanus]
MLLHSQAVVDGFGSGVIEVPSHYVDVYFQRVHTYTPMIYKPLFKQQILPHSDPQSQLLLYAIAAVSARWVELIANENPPGWIFYRQALRLLDTCATTPRLSTIQAMVLMLKYQEQYRMARDVCRPGLILGTAVQMSNDLRLSDIDNSIQPPAENEAKKRTFWMVFMYDLMYSIEGGRESCYGKIPCTTDLPMATKEEDLVESEEIGYYILFIELGRILSGIYQATRNAQIPTPSEVYQFHNRLTHFLYLLPPALMYPTTNYSAAKQPINNVQTGFLHMIYHFSLLLLHQPFTQMEEYKLKSCDQRTLCAVSASTITRIVETMIEDHGIEVFSDPIRGVQHTIHCVAMAATTHRFELASAKDPAASNVAKQCYVSS